MIYATRIHKLKTTIYGIKFHMITNTGYYIYNEIFFILIIIFHPIGALISLHRILFYSRI